MSVKVAVVYYSPTLGKHPRTGKVVCKVWHREGCEFGCEKATWPVCSKHHLRPCHYGCDLVRPPDRPVTQAERDYMVTIGVVVGSERFAPYQVPA